MPKKCMPGVICIENTTFVILFVIIIVSMIGIYFYYNHYILTNDNEKNRKKNTIKRESKYEREARKYNKYNINDINTNQSLYTHHDIGYHTRFPFGYSTQANDVLLNPYKAPLKDDRFFPSNSGDPRGIPIQISTRAVETTYRQVGILTRLNGDETILPLMGKPLFTNRDKWNFYTISDKNNMVKLPVSFKGKSCTNEYGCDNIYNGDTVYVEGYNSPFKVTMYDNNTIKYIPYI